MTVKPESLPPERFRRRVYPHQLRPRYPQTLETIAIHEAGHGVFMHSIGVPFSSIEVSATGGVVCLDHAWLDAARVSFAARPAPLYEGAPQELKEEAVCNVVAMYCAGLQAELLSLRIPLTGVLLPDDSDHDLARRILHKHCGAVTPLGYCQALARAVVSQRWADVERLAQYLAREGRLVLSS